MEKTNYILSSVDHALQIMDLLHKRSGIGVVEIAKEIGIGKSSAFRLLATLESREFVKKDAHSKYRLGFKFVQYSAVVLERFDIIQAAHPFLEDLCNSVGETAHLVVWDDDETVRFIDKVLSTAALRMDSYVGRAMPAYATSTGKVLLAHKSDVFIQQYLENVTITPFTENTCKTTKQLSGQLSAIRNKGYGVDSEEYEIGLTCYAAPVFDRDGKAIAAISASGPSWRVTANNKRIIEKLKNIAAEISDVLR